MQLPIAGRSDLLERGLEDWRQAAARQGDPILAERMLAALSDRDERALLEALFGNSPYLSDCAVKEPATLIAALGDGLEMVLREVFTSLKRELPAIADRAGILAALRRAKRRGSLLIALGDLTGRWPVDQVIETLSDLAAALLSAAVGYLLRQGTERGDFALPSPEDPERDCGYVLIAMGKLGARELNYSSDVDLIVLFDPAKDTYIHARGAQEGFVRLTRELVRLLEERTGDGYVYRTDLRLRPDPGVMPLAISIVSALTYYESLGQNWERAAMIKARPVAGDIALGESFLGELRPFVWRKHLDFWAIQDIHSIKRQINAQRGGSEIRMKGHNVKLGRGGIREIEFFAQTQQLIWGGRNPALRSRRTLDSLAALAEQGHVNPEGAACLTNSYRFLRRLENRLQMIDDQQTHVLPEDEEALEAVGIFMGYPDLATFEADFFAHLRGVEQLYARLFEEAPDLGSGGNLVFTGGEPEPGTVKTLTEMGFEDPARVFHLVRGWHHGRYRATRSTRARELLTELMPRLMEAFAVAPEPDQALLRFDAFLQALPTGVQLFSMLHANPHLLHLIGTIMGAAPRLADKLGRHPSRLEALLTPGFFEDLPRKTDLRAELALALREARDFQDVLDYNRRWAHDRRFQAGMQVLMGKPIDDTSRFLSTIADIVLEGLFDPVKREFERLHGLVPGAKTAVLALGKLGAREMTVASDLDLVFLYDLAGQDSISDGPKPLPAAQYFARFSQRYINALTAQTGEGELYEIDMRLRPSGNKGPIASSLAGYLTYHRTEAWTWEHMALTRARVVAGEPEFVTRIESQIHDILTQPRDPDALLRDIADMRKLVAREKPAASLWSVKYLRGGLMDIEFIAQYLQLRHAAARPEVLSASTQTAFALLTDAGLLGAAEARSLIAAAGIMRKVQGLLRLTVGPAFDADTLAPGHQAVLAAAMGETDFETLRGRLSATADQAYSLFRQVIEQPAAALPPPA